MSNYLDGFQEIWQECCRLICHETSITKMRSNAMMHNNGQNTSGNSTFLLTIANFSAGDPSHMYCKLTSVKEIINNLTVFGLNWVHSQFHMAACMEGYPEVPACVVFGLCVFWEHGITCTSLVQAAMPYCFCVLPSNRKTIYIDIDFWKWGAILYSKDRRIREGPVENP